MANEMSGSAYGAASVLAQRRHQQHTPTPTTDPNTSSSSLIEQECDCGAVIGWDEHHVCNGDLGSGLDNDPANE